MDPWCEYKRRRFAFRLALLLSLPLVILGFLIGTRLRADGLNALANIQFFMIPFAPIVITHIRRMLWPCPRCGRPFHVTWSYGNPYSRRCVHCGLPKWEPVSMVKASSGLEPKSEAPRGRLWDRELDG